MRGWNCNRLTLSHEPRSEARKRAAQSSKRDQLKRAKKDHTGNIASMRWDKNALKQEVESFADDKEFSWMELACSYNVKNKAGELAKKWWPDYQAVAPSAKCSHCQIYQSQEP